MIASWHWTELLSIIIVVVITLVVFGILGHMVFEEKNIQDSIHGTMIQLFGRGDDIKSRWFAIAFYGAALLFGILVLPIIQELLSRIYK